MRRKLLAIRLFTMFAILAKSVWRFSDSNFHISTFPHFHRNVLFIEFNDQNETNTRKMFCFLCSNFIFSFDVKNIWKILKFSLNVRSSKSMRRTEKSGKVITSDISSDVFFQREQMLSCHLWHSDEQLCQLGLLLLANLTQRFFAEERIFGI